MNEQKLDHHQAHSKDGLEHRPYWKRAHHDWKFWVALVLMFVAMAIYLGSIDLAYRPQPSRQLPSKPSQAL